MSGKIRVDTIYNGDCLGVLQRMPDECVDLVYLDPPFSVKQNRANAIEGRSAQEGSVLTEMLKLGDTEYVKAWLASRLWEMKRVLKPTGSIFLHLDPTLSAMAEGVMDDVFGRANFRNSISWCYTSVGSKGNRFPKKHDVVLFYVKSKEAFFEPQRVPYTPHALVGKEWVATEHDMVPGQKRTTHIDGKPVEDWWIDIPALRWNNKENVGYPTQKPEKLLERIIKATTKPGDIVLDPFAGSGTTGIVAKKLDRRFIMVDVLEEACDVIRKRFRDELRLNIQKPRVFEFYLKRDKNNVSKGLSAELSTDPFEVEKQYCDYYGLVWTQKSHDKGLDGFDLTRKFGLQAKNWASKIHSEVADRFIGALFKRGLKTGVIIGADITGPAKTALREAREQGLKVNWVDYREIGFFKSVW